MKTPAQNMAHTTGKRLPSSCGGHRARCASKTRSTRSCSLEPRVRTSCDKPCDSANACAAAEAGAGAGARHEDGLSLPQPKLLVLRIKKSHVFSLLLAPDQVVLPEMYAIYILLLIRHVASAFGNCGVGTGSAPEVERGGCFLNVRFLPISKRSCLLTAGLRD